MSKKDEGLRFNEGKNRFDLVHPWAHSKMVNVLTAGAEKYSDRNWEKGMAWSKVIASLKRHLNAIESGEDYDPETGELHAAHIACNAHFLTAYYKIYPQGDDRPHTYLNPPKIGLDIDEVLCNWLGDWTDEAPKNWWFDRTIVEKFEKMRADDQLDAFYLGLDPLISPDDIPFEPHCYITSRPVDTKVTEAWLDKHGFPARPVYTVGIDGTKVAIAMEQELDMFVDDGFHNFRDLNNAGICTFLMDAPHNERYDVGFKRIKSLKELL
jgi:5'(3')-deoxyribonucleotidase